LKINNLLPCHSILFHPLPSSPPNHKIEVI
jgi:hypothetical protein